MPHPLRVVTKAVKEFATKYPALVSGLIIYSYLLYSIVHYLLKTKNLIPTFYEVFDTFDALPFMWLLSVALVKIIDVRNQLHRSETERLRAQNEIERKKTQLDTLHEVVKSLQHHINNPLAVISLTVGTLRRQGKYDPELARQIEAIDESTKRIVNSMQEFFKTQSYETEHVAMVVGSMTALPSGGSAPPGTTHSRA